jgi:asparagine synthase (glutamine-hydrolysing)
MPGVTEHASAFTDASLWANALNETERMMYTDLVTYLPEDILTKLDRASMAVSLEARVPFLDYRVVEFAWGLPLEYKIHQGQGKRLLRLALERLVPTRLFERKKMGFGCPLAEWLRGPLRPWAEDLLDASAMAKDGILNPAPVHEAWRRHLTGKENRTHQLWCILMFQQWRQQWM